MDRYLLHEFWNQRATLAADPRSVTLDRTSPTSAAQTVRRYQSWMFRQLAALGCRGRHVLDLGCGNGDWTVLLAERASSLVAVDFAEGFVEHCRARLQERDLSDRARVVHADIAQFRCTSARDLVVAGGVVQNLSDSDVATLFAHVRKVLLPKGVFYLRTTVSRRSRRMLKSADYQAIYRPAAWYEKLAVRSGLRVRAQALATSFVAYEMAANLVGDNRFARWLAVPIKAVRWVKRAARPNDVLVWVAQRDDAIE